MGCQEGWVKVCISNISGQIGETSPPFTRNCLRLKSNKQLNIIGLAWDSNLAPLAPKARIIDLDQSATMG